MALRRPPEAESTRRSWPEIVERAAEIVRGYSTGVTLRQLFYRLVAAGLLPNTPTAYKQLSARTAEARRGDRFPALIDQGREVLVPLVFVGPQAARDYLATIYRRDRTHGQAVQLWLGVEKAGMVTQLSDWFSGYGVPIFALGGYCSQTLVDQVRGAVRDDGRPAVLLYAGDFDPSGEDIERDFVERTDSWREVHRIALTEAQVVDHGLPEYSGKESDTRAGRFVAKYGRLVQVELDALDPNDLRALYQDAIDDYWDASAFDAVLLRERTERESLR